MNNLILITDILAYIEANLTTDIKTDDIAKELYCSKSSVEKLFRVVTCMSIRDYMIRRRMSLAAKDIISDAEDSLLNIGIRYGYGSNEAFTRAFKSIWHVTPSQYRKNPVHYELFPALRLDRELMEDKNMQNKKKVDISELYDYLKERRNCYFVGVDIKGLVPINEIAHEAGDIAILTAMDRLSEAVGDEDIVFRIGGDEFVALTNSEDPEYAQNIVNKVLSRNGEAFKYKDIEIPLALYSSYYRITSKNLRYSELFCEMQKQVDVAKFESINN